MLNPINYVHFYESLLERGGEKYVYGNREDSSTKFEINLSVDFYKQNKIGLKYPRNAKYIIVVTHDVDNIYPSLGLIKYYMKRNPFKAFRYLLGRIRGNKRIFLNLKDITERESIYGFHPTFFLLVSDEDVLPLYKNYYRDEAVREEIYLVSKYAELGLHTGYYSFNNLQRIIEEKKRIEELIRGKIYGVRNHYLNFIIPRTWNLLSKAGFIYDTTLGFTKGFGYRNNMCYPYIPFDYEQNKWINIFELPLTVMDRALIKANIDPDMFFDKVKKFIESEAMKYGCFITLLWHNDLLYDPRFKKYSELFWRIIEYAYRNEGVILNGLEAINTWTRNISR